MKDQYRGTVRFKYQPSDFIVEELGENSKCSVSESINCVQDSKVDFGKLNLEDRRDFLTCDLEKVNIDHFKVMTLVGNALGKRPHELGYAGTKDKTAWTCQRISIFNPDIEKIKHFSIPGILLKNFRWGKHKIKVGDLEGNHFRIVLRDVDKDAIKILSKIRSSEFLPNYFGEQRFGSLRKDNVVIGTLLLKKKFGEAVFAFLTGYGDQESYEVIKAKRKLKTERNLVDAMEYFPKELVLEQKILNYLKENPKDWLGAIQLLGERTLLILVQSVQSKIFNDILERAKLEVHMKNQSLHLLGYNSTFKEGRIGEIEKEVLNSYGLEFKDFNVPQIPELSLKDSVRAAFFQVKNLDMRTEDDELFTPGKKIAISFDLRSGTYATTFLGQFFELREE